MPLEVGGGRRNRGGGTRFSFHKDQKVVEQDERVVLDPLVCPRVAVVYFPKNSRAGKLSLEDVGERILC